MDLPEFIDKVLTPLGAGLGVLLALRFSPQLRAQIGRWGFPVAIAVVLVIGATKWL